MPKHDLPDGNETGSNVIDFRAHLRHRTTQTLQDNGEAESEASDWDTYRRAEHSDGKRPKFNRHDILWLGVILTIGLIFWIVIRR